MKPLTITEMQILATAHKGKCISKVYINSYSPLEWECVQGHRWLALPKAVKQGHWCKLCAAQHRALSIEYMQQCAQKRGGRCFSSNYKNSQTALQWECNQGHRWRAKPNMIQQGHWCRICAGTEKKTLADMVALAHAKGGKCLSNHYANAYTKLLWECDRGHQWQAKPNGIQQGQWCPLCAGKQKKTLEDMEQLAAVRGGRFLSPIYTKSQELHLWECRAKHQWKARPASIIQGQWCPYCAGQIVTYDDIAKMAAERGGKPISDKYRGNAIKHEWECAERHRWLATPNSVQRGQWCPECAKGLAERTVRVIFRELWQVEFPTQKPRWLLNSRGHRMELDGYNAALGLAFEYHGKQHYAFNPHFHRGTDTLTQRIADDERKRTLCEAQGVKLIEIPHTVRTSELKEYILAQCARQTVPVPDDAHAKSVSTHHAYLRRNLERMQHYAEAHGGKCLSVAYMDAHTPLQWECQQGHRWKARPNYIQQGHWCRQCSGRRERTLADFQELARQRGGRCLSDKYENSTKHLLWECAKGHRWRATPLNVFYGGTWCAVCLGRGKHNIEEMRELAATRRGQCRSTEYRDNKTPLIWECVFGHQWRATPNSVLRGSWCGKCAEKGKNAKNILTSMQPVRGCSNESYGQ